MRGLDGVKVYQRRYFPRTTQYHTSLKCGRSPIGATMIIIVPTTAGT